MRSRRSSVALILRGANGSDLKVMARSIGRFDTKIKKIVCSPSGAIRAAARALGGASTSNQPKVSSY